MSTKTGHIDKIIRDKGFGFIAVDKVRYFFHMSECITDFDNLKEGDHVSFDSVLSEKGPRATEVQITS